IGGKCRRPRPCRLALEILRPRKISGGRRHGCHPRQILRRQVAPHGPILRNSQPAGQQRDKDKGEAELHRSIHDVIPAKAGIHSCGGYPLPTSPLTGGGAAQWSWQYSATSSICSSPHQGGGQEGVSPKTLLEHRIRI